MVRQELTSNQVTGWLGKPYSEQDQIGGHWGCLALTPGWSLLIPMVTSGLDGWSSSALGGYRTRLTGLLGPLLVDGVDIILVVLVQLRLDRIA